MFIINSSFYNFENTEFEQASGPTEFKSLLQLYLEERNQIEKKIRKKDGRKSLFR